ncbi:ferrous iron transport protein B [Fibrobacter sp. UWB15]|uniref:Fe(2+) transporter permease subunit FeoB n=1 Tax=unclassified Fibrobacter TaxID=2634177 RepID=UPI000918063A|nr:MULTISPECIES: Fe(2+) transporter permease subunit FeoB [unclassified Fibrobacter]PWJ67555.1 ferrous iron transport protein B [Fibrobacter sp. UWB6]SHF70799.1 ferrous iron transport protein B [Fibrobacter sp. UWB8]SMG12342.1 ferrous iron transport protein B [Fibrobacter sp. UWB15]
MPIEKEVFTIAIAGNPNCGKTALFNSLTGSNQIVGNWPGVTVEKKEGQFKLDNHTIRVVDLPGIYALFANSEDERAALDYLLKGEADLVVNILDATNLERNLFLTSQLMEKGVPMVLAVNMMDIAASRGIHVDLHKLEEILGVTAIGLTAVSPKSCEGFVNDLHKLLHNSRELPLPKAVKHSEVLEKLIEEIAVPLKPVADKLGASPRWTAVQYLEHSGRVQELADELGVEIPHDKIEEDLGEEVEFALADSRYSYARDIAKAVIRDNTTKRTRTDKLDKLFLNRILGIPLFLIAMYLVFWFAVKVGSAFIDFFDILFGGIFVDGMTELLTKIGAPGVVVALLANGIGTGIQTVSTFIPVIFFMFLCLSFLEDSGYMSRAAFVADRFMRFLGLPGKAFVPMIVGFGCSVPALMGTRTLENKRERFLTLFLVPFMSCGARLPVYALFGAAFFGESAGTLVFGIYLTGIVIALIYGLLLRHTVFMGKESTFIMELPPYHLPKARNLFRHAWLRLKEFVFRAGKVVLIMVTVLGFMGSVGTDGSFGNDNNEKSVLSAVGTVITPVFEPFGVERDNWPASVALFTGLFAKEAIVGTLNSLYAIEGTGDADAVGEAGALATADADESFSLKSTVKEALVSIPANLVEVFTSIANPLGVKAAIEESEGAGNEGAYKTMQAHFNLGRFQVLAYLLFILLYVPCLAAMGTAFRELGRFYGTLMMVFQTVIGWSLSVLFFQLTCGHSVALIITSVVLLAGVVVSLILIGRDQRKKKVFE